MTFGRYDTELDIRPDTEKGRISGTLLALIDCVDEIAQLFLLVNEFMTSKLKLLYILLGLHRILIWPDIRQYSANFFPDIHLLTDLDNTYIYI